jgi:endonuclease/exonuclease/phosphatase family metal-dependent hydrolase
MHNRHYYEYKGTPDKNRQDIMTRINKEIDSSLSKLPIIMAGDFNDHNNFKFWDKTTKPEFIINGLQVYTNDTNEKPPTTCCTTFPGDKIDKYGDYIMSSLGATNELIDIPATLKNPSDHLPILGIVGNSDAHLPPSGSSRRFRRTRSKRLNQRKRTRKQ